MKAVVMAGGEGSRLRPLTIRRPKPLIPICNRPVMEHLLALLKRHGIRDVVTTIHYLGEDIQNYFGDGSDFDMSIAYSIEDSPLGTAGSVKRAEHLLANERFLIVSGDALTDCDLTAAMNFHRERGALATMILKRVPNPLDFGVVITSPDDRISRFLEKPDWSEVFSDTVNTGMYILEPEIFRWIDKDRPSDWSSDIFPKLVREKLNVLGYVMEGYWTDIGTLEQCRDAQQDMLSGLVNLPFCGDERHDGVFVAEGTVIEPSAGITPPLCIGHNCRIKAGATVGPYTVLGDNVTVEAGAVVERSSLWDGCYVGPEAQIHSAMLASKVIVKRGVEIGEDAVIGERCLLDVGCTIRPRIRVWPDKQIERGSTVIMSMIWGTKWRGTLFRELGVAGLSNIEITPEFATRLASAYGSCLPPRSRVVTSRDSTRSSRMIKRAVIAALLSVGCDVIDLRSAAAPVARHFIKASGAAGAINIRKLPGNTRVTLLEMFDARGAYLPRNTERKVENAFFREDFIRIDSEDLGIIEFGSRAIEEYQSDFFHHLRAPSGAHALRIACDYGYSALAPIFPAMLQRMGIESISLNAFNDAKLAPRTEVDVKAHLANVRDIVGSLHYDMGALFTEEGERLSVVDDKGNVINGQLLFAIMAILTAETNPDAVIGMSVTAPSKLEQALLAKGIGVIRTKADATAITSTALDAGLTFAGDNRGGFVFPHFHPGFDAAFSFARLMVMLQQTGKSLSEVAASVPEFCLAYEQVSCPWESKGAVMRQISEDEAANGRLELVDGIKIHRDESWVLVLPDSLEPLFHVYAESDDDGKSRQMVQDLVQRIESMVLKK